MGGVDTFWSSSAFDYTVATNSSSMTGLGAKRRFMFTIIVSLLLRPLEIVVVLLQAII